MSPLPGWNVIPPGWAEHHQPTAEATMTADAMFTRISEGPAPFPVPDGWDATETIWSTKVRVQGLNREGSGVAAEQPVYTREYLVTAPVDGPPIRSGERGDIIVVLGRTLRITNEQFSSLPWERDFTCVDNLTQQNP
ncbi:DUF6093 family protein [Arthrobacter sp. NPDC097144]|uniref:DUF6093 family protein n=1 Tax=Arthrobacter sp. NPDC097144 TaxID=3363946 RepID=UPI0038000EEF